MNEQELFEQELPPVTVSAKKKKSNFLMVKEMIPGAVGINKVLIKVVGAILGLFLLFFIFKFFFYQPETPKAEIQIANKTTKSNVKSEGPTNYAELAKYNESKKPVNKKEVEKQVQKPAQQQYNQTPPNAQIPVPNQQPQQNFASPLGFNVATTQNVQQIKTEGNEGNSQTQGGGNYRNSVRGTKDFYNPSRVQEPISPYEVKAGSILPAILITGLNSDLPGVLIGQISENVYDTVSGKYLLLPQGTKLIGEYNSKINYGQSRVQVYWTRLIMPDGSELDLNAATGADGQGLSGLTGRVNNHTNKLINGALATSAFAILVSSQTKSISDSDSDPATVVAQNLTESANKIIDRNMQIQPTIEVKIGTKFNILVDQDLVLRPYQGL